MLKTVVLYCLTCQGETMQKLVVFVVVVAVFVIAIIAGLGINGFFNLPKEQEGTVKIGVMLPLTGDAAVYGESMGTALELTKEEINANGGILGKQVEFVIEDSKCDAKEGANAANSLINLKGMKIILAEECSGPTLAAAPIAENAGVFYLVAIASAPDIKYAGDYVFRTAPNDEVQGKDLAEIVFKKGFGKTTVLFGENAYGKGIEKVFSEEFPKLGGKIVSSQGFDQKASDFRAQLAKIKESDFDSVLIIGYPQAYRLIIKQMEELGIKTQIFASDTFKDESLVNDLGSLAEGIILTGFGENKSQSFSDFKERYKKRFGKKTGPYADYAYDSLHILKAGIELAKSFDPEVLKEKFYQVEYKGATGLTKFDSFGESNKKYDAHIVKNGKFELYKG